MSDVKPDAEPFWFLAKYVGPDSEGSDWFSTGKSDWSRVKQHAVMPLYAKPVSAVNAEACTCGNPRELGVVHRPDAPCFVYLGDSAQPARQSDSSLNAAAPDLLEALRDMLSGWKYIRESHGDLYGVGWDRAQTKAETAITKATGDACAAS